MWRIASLIAVLGLVPSIGFAATDLAVESSLRPAARTSTREAVQPVVVAQSNARFQSWIKAFRKRALAAGISGQVYDRATANIRYNAKVVERDRNQTEFTKQIWEYLEIAASDQRIKNGKRAYQQNKALLTKIERRYDVDARVVMAIWGLESAYGARRGDIGVIEALATLSFDGRRQKFFTAQLIEALKIIQNGDTSPARMKGSWAGAMGHTQFIPTSYAAFAQDFHGDGRRDIWSDNPTDALASTANYLKQHGWVKGQPWGMEVKLPNGFDYSKSGEKTKKPVSYWRSLGIKQIDGSQIPNHGKSSILLPGGSRGAAFIIFKNFHVIERYNPADAYVIGVGHLGDRIMGGRDIVASWPIDEQALSFKEKKQLQRQLRRKGFKVEKIDGIIGPLTIAAIRGFQRSISQTPDGFASKKLLAQIRK